LRAGGLVRGLSYLAFGSFETVKAEIERVLRKRPPFGVLGEPFGGPGAPAQVSYTPGQPITLSGWVLDTARVPEVRIEIDRIPVGALPVSTPRPDVCTVYPGYVGCPDVGFSGTVATDGLGPCPQVMRVLAEDSDGNVTTLGERVIAPSAAP
jgi:hypothetical protein